ncbi:MAG TPA: DUF3800 domain-containing protein [Bacillales bacterium]|nr:DUF3800 domain-containing protein [Bacillales bacterium]
MKYQLYFDESNKLDQPNGGYSYYGAYGANASVINDITSNVISIYDSLNTKSEMHFREYKDDKHIKKYFRTLNYVLNQNVNINIFIVNNEDAKNTAVKMNVDLTELRKLFYVKIPERLFYGITRYLQSGTDVEIFVDSSDEYEKLGLYTKLKEQMNAHSAYRNKCYKVHAAIPLDSKISIPLQIIDTLMGIVVFLMEKAYKTASSTSKIKSDLIYRLLIEGTNIQFFQKQITLYKWEGNEEQISEIPVSQYITEFLVYKTQYDLQEMGKFREIMLRNPHLDAKEYRKLIEYPNARLRMLQGYFDEITTGDRNISIR